MPTLTVSFFYLLLIKQIIKTIIAENALIRFKELTEAMFKE